MKLPAAIVGVVVLATTPGLSSAQTSDKDCVLSRVSTSDRAAVRAASDRDVANFLAGKGEIGASRPDAVERHLGAIANACAKRLKWPSEVADRAVTYSVEALYLEALEQGVISRGVPKTTLDRLWASLSPKDFADLDLPQAPDPFVRRVMGLMDKVGAPRDQLRPLMLMYLVFRREAAWAEMRLELP